MKTITDTALTLHGITFNCINAHSLQRQRNGKVSAPGALPCPESSLTNASMSLIFNIKQQLRYCKPLICNGLFYLSAVATHRNNLVTDLQQFKVLLKDSGNLAYFAVGQSAFI